MARAERTEERTTPYLMGLDGTLILQLEMRYKTTYEVIGNILATYLPARVSTGRHTQI